MPHSHKTRQYPQWAIALTLLAVTTSTSIANAEWKETVSHAGNFRISLPEPGKLKTFARPATP